jgi:hypothetical protein
MCLGASWEVIDLDNQELREVRETSGEFAESENPDAHDLSVSGGPEFQKSPNVRPLLVNQSNQH